MFPFFKRRDEGPLAVEDAVFTSEDIFVLPGESLDLGCFAAQPRNLNLARFKAEGSSAWRERLVKRFEPRGLVDGLGRPCPELAYALEPLKEKGVFIGDGNIPSATDPVEKRTAVICFSPGFDNATCVVRQGRGFCLRPFSQDSGTRELEFLSAYGLEGLYCPTVRSQHFIRGDYRLSDTSLVDSLSRGPDGVRAWCAAWGIDECDQLGAVARRGGSRFHGLTNKYLLSADYRKCEYKGGFDYRVPAPAAGEFRTKGVVVLPEMGFVDFWGAAPRGPEYDWYKNPASRDQCRYAGFDFLGPGEGLLDNLLKFYDYPEDGNEY